MKSNRDGALHNTCLVQNDFEVMDSMEQPLLQHLQLTQQQVNHGPRTGQHVAIQTGPSDEKV